MVSAQQLELNFKVALEEVADVPEQANAVALWEEFEKDLFALPQREQLRVAGAVLAELADLCEAKSEILWEDWQDAHNVDGPSMGSDAFHDVVRHTQELDFSNLVERHYQMREPIQYEEDEISAVDKDAALALVEALEATDSQSLKAQALAVSHAENISAWIKALAVARIESPLRLVDVQAQLKMPLMEVWLAALLGGFNLEQRGGFYDTSEVWISARAQEAKG